MGLGFTRRSATIEIWVGESLRIFGSSGDPAQAASPVAITPAASRRALDLVLDLIGMLQSYPIDNRGSAAPESRGSPIQTPVYHGAVELCSREDHLPASDREVPPGDRVAGRPSLGLTGRRPAPGGGTGGVAAARGSIRKLPGKFSRYYGYYFRFRLYYFGITVFIKN